MQSRRFLMLAALLSWGGLVLPARAEPTSATVERVLTYYRAQDYLDQALPEVEKALARRRKEITVPDARANDVLTLARRIFRKANLFSVLKLAYAKQIALENMQALYAFQLSPLGIKLRRGIDAAYAVKEKDRQSYFEKEAGKLLKPNRKNAINTYINAAEQVDLHTSLITSADLVINMALNSYVPKEARDTQKTLKEKARARKTGYNESARQSFMVFNFYVFRDMKNDELDELSKFAVSPVGQAGSRAFAKALEMAMESGGVTLVTELSKSKG